MVTSEVKPAINREPKNSTPNRGPPGIWLIMVGKAMNANPIPEVATSSTATPEVEAMKPRVAKTPIPAKTSKPELDSPTTVPRPDKFERRLR